MDCDILLDLASDLGYRLAMSGAETFRVEESITRILRTYGFQAEVFAIPNCLTVCIHTDEGRTITRMRRIGYHGNDLDSVERYSNLSRRICWEKPELSHALQWFQEADAAKRSYPAPIHLLGNYLGACGFSVFFGATLCDSLLAGLCGLVVGLVGIAMDRLKANLFFRTILASFLMSLLAYALNTSGIVSNADTIVIGTLMILVPGLLFTNAMRDIIYGDTNSGVNRIVQVFLIAAAIALGTAASYQVVANLWYAPLNTPAISYSLPMQLLACTVGGIGFTILNNIYFPGGLLCVLGGVVSWAVYAIAVYFTGNDLVGYFWASIAAALYSETMARIRKYPAISYLVISIFPLIPGASVYYTMNFAIRSQADRFADNGLHTVAIAGVIALGILLVSTTFRLWSTWRNLKK